MIATKNNLKQCPYCQCWITSAKGGFKHHIRTCQQKDTMKLSANKLPSTNPLLSRHMVDQEAENIEYDCNNVDEDEGIVNDDISQFGTNNEHKLDNYMYKSPKSSSLLTFQVGQQ